MFKNQIRNELLNMDYNRKNIDTELINIKVALHTLEKLGLDTTELEKQIDNVGVEFYKFKNMILDKGKELSNYE